MTKKISLLLLLIAIVLALFTHFLLLGHIPGGLNADEAGQGYSAYSLLKTGKDEFGKAFPILFRSSEDFKTPVYTYLLVPTIAIFGLNPFAVRFPSAIFSILTVPVLYFLVIVLREKNKSSLNYELLAATTAILLAISPWAILFGRTAYECSVALFFLTSGCLTFYLGIKKPYLIVLAAILFAISIPAYHSERIVTPLLCLALFIRHHKLLLSKTNLKYLIAGGIIALLITLPTLSVIRTPGFFARVSDLNILSVGSPAGVLKNYNGFFAFLVNSKILLNTREFASLYLSYFSPRFIFILGDSGPRSSFPEVGTFFVWEAPFYLYGLYLLLKKEKFTELKFFTLAFLFISPLTAALTRDPYSSTRALQMVIPLVIIVSLGIVRTYTYIKTRNLKTISLIIFAGLIVYSLLKLYSSAVILNETYRGPSWEYGWQQVADTLKTLDQSIPVTVDSSRNVGYIELAFFTKADPLEYQKDNFEVSPAEYYTNLHANSQKIIGNITWRPIVWEKDLLIHQYLVGDSLALSDQQIKEHHLKLIREIDYKDGSPDLRIVETNSKSFASK